MGKAIQEVLKEALIHDGLARGLRERPGRSSGAHALSSRTGASPARHKSTSRTTSRNRRPNFSLTSKERWRQLRQRRCHLLSFHLTNKNHVVLKSDACSVEQL